MPPADPAAPIPSPTMTDASVPDDFANLDFGLTLDALGQRMEELRRDYRAGANREEMLNRMKELGSDLIWGAAVLEAASAAARGQAPATSRARQSLRRHDDA